MENACHQMLPGFEGGVTRLSKMQLFLDFDDKLCFVKFMLEEVALSGELGDLQRFGLVRVDSGATLVWGKRCRIGDGKLAAPGVQISGIHAFALHQ